LTRTKELEAANADLLALSAVWTVTRESSRLDTLQAIPEAILERINSTLTEIVSIRSLVITRNNVLLVLENQISQEQIAIAELIEQIESSETELRTRLFVRDGPHLMEIFRSETDSLNLIVQLPESWRAFVQANVVFVQVNKNRIYLHLAIYAVLLTIMLRYYFRNRKDTLFHEDDEVLRASSFFVARPFSAALLLTLFFSIWLYEDVSSTVYELVIILWLIPVLRLMPGVIRPERRLGVVILAGLFVLDVLHNNAVGFAVLQRILMLLITIAAIALFTWMYISVSEAFKRHMRPWPVILFKLTPLILLVLFCSLVANFVGSVSLAVLLTDGVVRSILSAVLLYTIASVLDGFVTLMIRRRRAKALQFIKTYADQLERWAMLAIHFVTFAIWIRATLRIFDLWQPVTTWGAKLLDYSWQFGTVSISVEEIFDFLMVLVMTFIVVRVARIFLDIEIFPRVKLPRGITGAISMIVRYTLVGVGIFLAISSLGIDLGKFGLMAGALGVGLGFGLQNVIANFVSGIILAFERPVQVNDIVEIGEVSGNIQQIGVRSSTVKTFDGSEVIVPNSDLMSNKVVNWTLTDTRRRMILPVKVAFDSDPEQVLAMLLQVAKEHPAVLDDPEPVVTFNGFGEYFLDFTLYYWITGDLFKNKTEVALGVHRSIQAAGILTPRPQRDLNLNIVDAVDKLQINKVDSDTGKD
jgi:small-conductance mechanosensitive channel